MGFKCPACRQDFGTAKAEWEAHVATAHEGIASLVVSAIKRLGERDEPDQGPGQRTTEGRIRV